MEPKPLLPKKWSYLDDALARFAWIDEHLNQESRERICNLSEDELSRLADVYEVIADKCDATEISDWIQSFPARERYGTVVRRVFILFIVFLILGDRDISPFDSYQVQYDPTEPPSDWSKLPPRLAYLGEPADKYGVYQSEDSVERFLKHATFEDMQSLTMLRDRILDAEDSNLIFEWMADRQLTEPEVAKVAFLIELLEAADLSIDFSG